jgi:hypothetical protein
MCHRAAVLSSAYGCEHLGQRFVHRSCPAWTFLVTACHSNKAKILTHSAVQEHHCGAAHLVVTALLHGQSAVCLHADECQISRGADQSTQTTSSQTCKRLLPQRDVLQAPRGQAGACHTACLMIQVSQYGFRADSQCFVGLQFKYVDRP